MTKGKRGRRFPLALSGFERCWVGALVSHISRKTSEIWGTLGLVARRNLECWRWRQEQIAKEFCGGSYNAGGFGCIMRIVQDFCNSPGKRRFAFLLPLGLLMLSMAVFGWGLQYKLSLYQAKDSISHLTPEAKLLSQKERPVARLAMDARPPELPAFPLLPALLMVAFTPGLYQAATRYARTASTEGSRAPLPPCLQAVFLRPPPVLS
jgi:hypothetical protein